MTGTSDKPRLPSWVLVVVTFLLMVSLIGGFKPFMGDGWPDISGDNAWRLVEVEDLLAGQAWTDTTQYRDNTPYGSPMHWSRLIDAPVAGLSLLFGPLYGADAPLAAASLWPLLVLIGFLAAVVVLAQQMAGAGARVPALLVTMLALPAYSEFMPGSVDHHNVQMVLVLLLMLTTVAGRTSVAAAIGAGLVAATAIAVGTECLPAVLAALFFFPLFWVLDARAARAPVIAFALTFGAGLLGHLIAVTDLRAGLVPACDALSITYVVAGASYAIAVTAAVLVGGGIARPFLRLIPMGLAGVAAVAVTLVLFPECRGGPYSALDPDLTSILLTEFTEAQPLGRWLMITLGGTAGLVVLPFAGLIGAIGLAWSNRDGRRVDWLVIAGFSIMLVLVMVVQVRGLRLAILPALPVGASLIAGAWSALRSRPGLVPAARLAGTIFLFAGVLHVLGVFLLRPGADEKPERATAYAECIAPESMKHLASLPEGRIVSYIFIGPTLLMWTPHAIVSAGYHRGEQGMRDALAFVSTDETAALRIARERDLDYLVFCKDVPLNSGLHGLPAFQGITDTGVRWSWLRALSEPDEPVQIYAIDTTAN